MSQKDPPIIPDVYIRLVEQLIAKEHALDHVVPLWAASLLLRSPAYQEKTKLPLMPEITKAARHFLAAQNPKTGEIPWRLTPGAGGLSRVPLLASVFKDSKTFDHPFPASVFLMAAVVNILQMDPVFTNKDDLDERCANEVRDLAGRLDTTDTKAFGPGTPEERGQHAFGWLIPGGEGWSAPPAKARPCSLFNNLLTWQVFRRFAASQCTNLRSGIVNAVLKDDASAIFTDEHPAGLALFLFTFPDAAPDVKTPVQNTLSRRTESFQLPVSDVLRAWYVIKAMKYLKWADTITFMRSVRLFVARSGTVPTVLHGGQEDRGFLNAVGSVLIADIAGHHH